MPRERFPIPHVKRVRSKGRDYLYFDTGDRKPSGAIVYAPLPAADDPSFAAKLASLKAVRTRREQTANALTVGKLADRFQSSPHYRGLSPRTRETYDHYLLRLAKLMPTAPAGEIEPSDMRRLRDGLADTPGVANMMIRVTGALFDWGRKQGMVTNHPTRDVESFKLGEHAPWPQAVLDDALHCNDATVRLLVRMLYCTGQRIGDVLNARWADLGERWVMTQQKTGKAMSIRLHSLLVEELAVTPRHGPLVFVDASGKRLTRQRARTILQAFAAERGEKVVTHGLRKNATNALFEAGCTAAEVAAITGMSLQIAEHYAKLRDQSKLGDAAIYKMERAGNGETNGKPAVKASKING